MLTRPRSTVVVLYTVLGCVGGLAVGQESDPGHDQLAAGALDALRAKFFGVRTTRGDEGERCVYGRPMTSSLTAEKAVRSWLNTYGTVFGARTPDLRIESRHAVGAGRNSVFVVQQYIDGLPVEDGIGRIVVRHGGRNHMTYAAARVVRPAVGGFPPQRLDGADAVAAVRATDPYASLTDFSTPTRAIYVSTGDFLRATPARVWKFEGWRGPQENFAAYTFFVDDSDGTIVHVRDEVYHIDFTGQVTGITTPGTLPDTAGNPPQSAALSDLEVRSELGASGVSDAAGEFTLSNAGTSAILVEADLAGPWARVQTVLGEDLRFEQSVVPPGPVSVLFNAAPAEFATAQVNGFLHTVSSHNFYKQRQPDFTGLDLQLACSVNLPDTCNAFFTPLGLSINFFNAGDGCVNTAYSSVINHEYGHFVVNQHRLPQGAFGEGYGDCLAILLQDDAVVGRDFAGPGNAVRDVVAANQQYPCFGEIHVCGQVLGGVWWNLKVNLQSTLGDDAGLEYARQLFTDWTEITIGGRLRNSAHPLTAVEVLTADDDDGDITNGTPHESAICDAFAAHGIGCPGDCESFGRLRATCRDGSTVRASIGTGLPEGAEITFTLDGGSEQTAVVSRFGRAATSWSDAPAGAHEVCVPSCPDVCATATCVP